jgi:hypothetical protein
MTACRQVVWCRLLFGLLSLVGLLNLAHAAKKADKADIMAELRRKPKPTLDATGKFQTIRKHFVQNDPETGEYTQLIYNITRPIDAFYVDLESEEFNVANISCTPERLGILTSSLEGMVALHEALLHSSSGLIFVRHGCHSAETGLEEPAFRTFWTRSWATTTKAAIENATVTTLETVKLETVDASPFAFLGGARISFFTNHTVVAEGTRRWTESVETRYVETFGKGYMGIDLINFNYDVLNDAARTSTIDLYRAENYNAKVTCENCYLYMGGGVGFELDIDWFDDAQDRRPTYVKLWIEALLTGQINLKAEVSLKLHSYSTLYTLICKSILICQFQLFLLEFLVKITLKSKCLWCSICLNATQRILWRTFEP